MRRGLFVTLLIAPGLVFATPKRPAKKKADPPATPKPAEPATPAPTETESASDGAKPSPVPASPADDKDKDPAKDKDALKDKDAKDKDKKAEAGPDVDSLRQEYLSLRDELFKSRARANSVASQLYSTRIQIKLTYTTARYYNPAKATIRLDGASVYENASGAIASDDGVRFDGYIAPGRHVVTFRVEATGKDDDSFTSATETAVVVKAVGGKDLVVAARAKDSGDIAYEWKRKEAGSYGLGIDVAVRTTARPASGEEGKGKK